MEMDQILQLYWDILGLSRETSLYFDGLVQERRNSSALAMELRLSCTNPSISSHDTECEYHCLHLGVNYNNQKCFIMEEWCEMHIFRWVSAKNTVYSRYIAVVYTAELDISR